SAFSQRTGGFYECCCQQDIGARGGNSVKSQQPARIRVGRKSPGFSSSSVLARQETAGIQVSGGIRPPNLDWKTGYSSQVRFFHQCRDSQSNDKNRGKSGSNGCQSLCSRPRRGKNGQKPLPFCQGYFPREMGKQDREIE